MKESNSSVVTIDGAKGEGGGQVLRTSLSLSMITGKPFKIVNIRANRKKPGLLRQHYTAVKAAASICNAKVKGFEIGAKEIIFIPGEIKPGKYHFKIGSAGSTILVAQTILLPLALSSSRSTVVIEGGTHNKQAPTFDFFNESYLQVLRKVGINVDAKIIQHGFYPAGGGKIEITIRPIQKFKKINLSSKEGEVSIFSECIAFNINNDIAESQLEFVKNKLSLREGDVDINSIPDGDGFANILSLKIKYRNICEVVAAFGERGKHRNIVAESACEQALEFMKSSSAVGTYLADQILLPISFCGGRFTTFSPSEHFYTNIETIKRFINLDIQIKEIKNVIEVNVSRDSNLQV